MKFIHFADAHLDSPFLGLSFLPSKSFEQIHQAPNQSLTSIVDLALQEKVDLVLIAGDTFDSPRPNPSSQLFFAGEIERLTAAHIQVVMIFGNHDHMRAADLLVPDSPFFKLLGDGEQIEGIKGQTASGFTYEVNGFSYLQNHITANKAMQLPAKSGHYTFGLMHAQEQSGQNGQNVYAPFTLSELKNLNYDYFALGHIHLRQMLSTSPLIVYPGNIQGRHVNELGPKGCILGEINEQTGQTEINFVQTGPIVWQRVKVELAGPIAQTALQSRLLATLQADVTTYYSLQLVGAEYLNDQERELVEDSDFWQLLSSKLDHGSQLVDVRFAPSSHLEIAASDRVFFEEAENEIFTPEYFAQLCWDWSKKDDFAAQLAVAPDFLKDVRALAEVKLNSRLKGISDEIN
ncbi:metallophosphoesterase family protein [Lactobacillus xylocopicola]|uniref:Phosphoesterase n=1 Tax=Lactobacillus xylocopicola TaxID=2976676 RepID=A0ABN6SK57_9LACO|nr:DNA repair exonuclease [Lactobacillus xylocopicola]BDR60761.1 phosphoesterase [Lactobacillus xylocopicola]